MGLFILIKKKGAKVWKGAIPARKGISAKNLRTLARKQIRPGFTFRIITGPQLKRLLLRLGRKGILKTRIGRRGLTVRRRRKKKR